MAAMAMALIMLAVVALPAMSLFGSDSQGYSGESYTVRYETEDIHITGSNGDTGAKSITVTYYGTPVAEYNPQFWNESSFVGEFEGDLETWYPISFYKQNDTQMFTGWKDLNGATVNPGDDISEAPKDSDGDIVLTATWGKLNSTSQLSRNSGAITK